MSMPDTATQREQLRVLLEKVIKLLQEMQTGIRKEA